MIVVILPPMGPDNRDIPLWVRVLILGAMIGMLATMFALGVVVTAPTGYFGDMQTETEFIFGVGAFCAVIAWIVVGLIVYLSDRRARRNAAIGEHFKKQTPWGRN